MFNSNCKRVQRVADVFFPDGISGECELIDNLTIPGETSKKVLSMLVYNKCATRIVSPTVLNGDVETIALAISAMYEYKWRKLYETTQLEYNPIQNYNMSETETVDDVGEKGATGENTGETKNSTEMTLNDSDSVYGFNSVTPHGDKQKDQSQSVESTGENSGSYMQSENTKNNRERSLERSGNIGVMSTQQMIEAERDVAKFNYLNEVINDIADFISLRVW